MTAPDTPPPSEVKTIEEVLDDYRTSFTNAGWKLQHENITVGEVEALEKTALSTAKSHLESIMQDYAIEAAKKAEIALARKVLGVSSMVHKRKGVTQAMRLKHLTTEMQKIIPDSGFITMEDELRTTNLTRKGKIDE